MGSCTNQAEFARRVGELAGQHNHIENISLDKRYDATPHICLVQGLLTYCKERIEERCTGSFFDQEVDNQTPFWGLTREMIQPNNFYTDWYGSDIKRKTVITVLRNAVSHPHKVDPNSLTPSTGFVSVNPANDQITTFAFVDAFNVVDNKPHVFAYQKEASEQLEGRFPEEAIVEKYGRQFRIAVRDEDIYKAKPLHKKSASISELRGLRLTTYI